MDSLAIMLRHPFSCVNRESLLREPAASVHQFGEPSDRAKISSRPVANDEGLNFSRRRVFLQSHRVRKVVHNSSDAS